jgi:cell division septation protein DedD
MSQGGPLMSGGKGYRSAAAGVAAVVLALVLGSCASEEVDRQDELGVSGEGDYELVIVDASADSITTTAESGAETDEADQAEQGTAPSAAATVEQIPKAQEALALALEGDDAIHYAADGAFTVQVGLYRDAKAAGRVVRELSGAGYPAYAIAQPDKKGIRVRIGYFKTRDGARRFGERLKKDRKLDYWVDSRSNEKY